jgi:hypothetical protein
MLSNLFSKASIALIPKSDSNTSKKTNIHDEYKIRKPQETTH